MIKAAVSVAHYPTTALKVSYGVTQVGKRLEMMQRRINVSIGTDGNNASNYSDMMRATLRSGLPDKSKYPIVRSSSPDWADSLPGCPVGFVLPVPHRFARSTESRPTHDTLRSVRHSPPTHAAPRCRRRWHGEQRILSSSTMV
jgi:hypothetical protein